MFLARQGVLFSIIKVLKLLFYKDTTMPFPVPCYIGLVHGPVKAKDGQEITTSVTNLDIHDIARTARTFGFKKYYLITPIKNQQSMVKRILGFWEADSGLIYNPDRKNALADAEVIDSIELAIQRITEIEGKAPCVVVTGANFESYDGQESELMRKIHLDGRPMFLLFGTGWGLTALVVEQADFRLEPIFGIADDEYNHLSVRSAVAIYCDRLARSL
ncbi:MAG TPA: RNA methyltransferase [Bacteriovoracaceae bacterium]|nr:RNA methyltransferase [Bacteriovoracaceae bacterium]